MRLTDKGATVVIAVLSTLCWCLLALICVFGDNVEITSSHSIRCVQSMYSFQTPQELLQNQRELEVILSPQEYERLNIDNELRAINAYYKFGYTSSRADVQDYSDTYALYKLKNANILYDDLWVFLCSVNKETGLVENVHEYKVLFPKGNVEG